MEHKNFFAAFGDIYLYHNGEPLVITVEGFYQAIKQRLCEELRVPEPHPFPLLATEKQRLIDTTEKSNER